MIITIITVVTLMMMVLAMMAMIAMTSDGDYFDEYDNNGNLCCDGSGSGFFTTFQRAEQVLQRIL